MSGQIVGAAVARCLREERNWKSRDEFALLSMAQTRATAKALRLPLGFVMSLAGFDATPAEEMPKADEPAPKQKQPAQETASEATDTTVQNTVLALAAQLGVPTKDLMRKKKDEGWEATLQWLKDQARTAGIDVAKA